jgi:glucose-6-phosphate 1-epimerase
VLPPGALLVELGTLALDGGIREQERQGPGAGVCHGASSPRRVGGGAMTDGSEVRVVTQGEFEKVVLRSEDGARCEIFLHGAHVSSWVPAGGEECLFMSARSELGAGAAIRGGVPVVFPQFSVRGPLPRHGFARTVPWELAGSAAGQARFRLRDSGATRAMWPHAFEANVVVEVGGDALRIELAVTNRGGAPFAFNAALHTYLRVSDVGEAAVEGLQGVRCRDNKPDAEERTDAERELRFRGEVDRLYLGAPSLLRLRDPARTIEIRAEGFPDAVVWNPGAAVAAGIPDLEPGGWQRYACVEAAAVGEPVELTPGQSWRGAQALRVLSR